MNTVVGTIILTTILTVGFIGNMVLRDVDKRSKEVE